MITHDDIMELKRVFDDRYVLQSDCDTIQKGINSKLSNDDKRIEILIRGQKITNWLSTTIAAGVIALLIKVFLGG